MPVVTTPQEFSGFNLSPDGIRWLALNGSRCPTAARDNALAGAILRLPESQNDAR